MVQQKSLAMLRRTAAEFSTTNLKCSILSGRISAALLLFSEDEDHARLMFASSSSYIVHIDGLRSSKRRLKIRRGFKKKTKSSLILPIGTRPLCKRLQESRTERRTLAREAPTTGITPTGCPASSQSIGVNTLKPFSEIPGPAGLPLIGTLWDYVRSDGLKFNKMFEIMEQRANEYGPIYKEKIGHMLHVVISDPVEYMKVIRVDGKYPNRMEMFPISYYRRKRGLELGTVNGQGEEWYRPRKILVKKTLKPQEIVEYVQPMSEVGDDFIRRLKRLSTTAAAIPELDMEIFKWALESIGTVLFEERIGCFADPPPQLAKDFIINLMGFFHYNQPLMYGIPIYKLYPTKNWKIFEAYADNVMRIGQIFVNKKLEAIQNQEDKSVGETSAFLTYMLSQTTLSPEEVNSNCVDLMMGAVETTSNSLLWMLYCLARSPNAQDALYADTTSALADSGGRITAESLQHLHYAKACLKETFRLFPITYATSRRISEDITLGGYHIPKATHCQANLYGMGRNKDLFPDPLSYTPERWLRENNDGPQMYLSNLVFGHGPRMCLGRRLAEQEIYIALTKIIQNFKLEYNDKEELHPVLNTVMTPDRPLRLKLIPRN